MSSLFSTKLSSSKNIFISKKNNIKRLLSQKDSIKNRKNLTFNQMNYKYDTSQGLSTNRFTLQNENNDFIKTEYNTILTFPSIDYVDLTKEKTINSNYNTIESTNNSTRSKSHIKDKSNNILYSSKYYNNSMSTFKFYHKKFKKKNKKEKFKGVPKEFIESMRLDLDSNIIKANKYLLEEKQRLIKANSNLKYYFFSNRNNKIKKKKELKKEYEYQLRIENLKRNRKVDNGFKLNDYYTKLLLKENEQHFCVDRPMIDKSKFNPRFILYKNTDEIKKEHPNIDVRNIFSRVVFDKFFLNRMAKKEKLTKKVIYQKFITLLKKSAIEFKNITIPFKEYVEYYYNSQRLEEQLLKNEYPYLIGLIKKEKKKEEEEEEEEEEEDNKDIEVTKFLKKNKLTLFIIDFFGKSVLYFAVKYKLYFSMTKIITYGCNVNYQDFKGRTSLHYAVINEDVIAVTILIYYLANPLIKDKNDYYPLDYITRNNIIIEDKRNDKYIIKEILVRSSIIRKFNKYISWREFSVRIRRGIQYLLFEMLPKDRYYLIFSFIENPDIYYK